MLTNLTLSNPTHGLRLQTVLEREYSTQQSFPMIIKQSPSTPGLCNGPHLHLIPRASPILSQARTSPMFTLGFAAWQPPGSAEPHGLGSTRTALPPSPDPFPTSHNATSSRASTRRSTGLATSPAPHHTWQQSLQKGKYRTYRSGGGTGKRSQLLVPVCPQQLAQDHHTHPSTQKQNEK